REARQGRRVREPAFAGDTSASSIVVGSIDRSRVDLKCTPIALKVHRSSYSASPCARRSGNVSAQCVLRFPRSHGCALERRPPLSCFSHFRLNACLQPVCGECPLCASTLHLSP